MVEKNLRKQKAKANRCLVTMNTGTRTHKSPKDYKRRKRWTVADGE